MTCAKLSIALLLLGCAPSPRPKRPTEPIFDFHVGFWVNLHQRLYAESSPRGVREPLQADAPEDQARWDRAVEVYRRRWPNRTLLTLLDDETLVAINRRLSQVDDLGASGVPDDLRAALEAAAPIYRRLRWPDDERTGHAFIDRLMPLVNQHGTRLKAALEKAYGSPWPEAPIRVDVACYAGPVGAYTVLGPTHISVAAADPRHAGDAALEILFHESSHALVHRIERAITAASARLHRTVPPTLWHAILFWTTGEIVKRELGPDYIPYGYRNGIYTRAPDWATYEPLLARLWPAVLDGRRTIENAIDELISALPNA